MNRYFLLSIVLLLTSTHSVEAGQVPHDAVTQIADVQAAAAARWAEVRNDSRPGEMAPAKAFIAEFEGRAVMDRATKVVVPIRELEYAKRWVAGSFVVKIAIAYEHACVVTSSAQIVCFGEGTPGQWWRHSDGSVTKYPSTPASANLTDISVRHTAIGNIESMPEEKFIDVSTSRTLTCGLRGDYQVVCWGDKDEQLALVPDGTFRAMIATDDAAPITLSPNGSVSGEYGESSGPWETVDGWLSHVCGLRSNGTAECWGDNGVSDVDYAKCIERGPQWRPGLPLGRTMPAEALCVKPYSQKPPSGVFKQVAAGYHFTCGLRRTGAVECWGDDRIHGFEQIAATGEGFSQVDAGIGSVCATSMDGRIQCWGDLSSPSGNTWTSVAVGKGAACGVRVDGSVACWGADTEWTGDMPSELRSSNGSATPD